MKRVIKEPINKAVIVINDTKEFKTYIGDSAHSAFILKQSHAHKWCWISLFDPKTMLGSVYSTFILALESGLTKFTVYEMEDFSDFLEFLKDREEVYIEPI